MDAAIHLKSFIGKCSVDLDFSIFEKSLWIEFVLLS